MGSEAADVAEAVGLTDALLPRVREDRLQRVIIAVDAAEHRDAIRH
jgi:hypothetical protein